MRVLVSIAGMVCGGIIACILIFVFAWSMLTSCTQTIVIGGKEATHSEDSNNPQQSDIENPKIEGNVSDTKFLEKNTKKQSPKTGTTRSSKPKIMLK